MAPELRHASSVIRGRSAFFAPALLNGAVAAVWIGNGLFAKLLNLAPRHQEIVTRVLSEEHAAVVTRLIGAGELLLAAWILSARFPRLAAAVQVALVAVMNALELRYAPDLLLWGGFNGVFASAFAGVVLWNGFYVQQRSRTGTAHV